MAEIPVRSNVPRCTQLEIAIGSLTVFGEIINLKLQVYFFPHRKTLYNRQVHLCKTPGAETSPLKATCWFAMNLDLLDFSELIFEFYNKKTKSTVKINKLKINCNIRK